MHEPENKHNEIANDSVASDAEQPTINEVREAVIDLLAEDKTVTEVFDQLVAAGVEPTLARTSIDSVLAERGGSAVSKSSSPEMPIDAFYLAELAAPHRRMLICLPLFFPAWSLTFMGIKGEGVVQIIADILLVVGFLAYFEAVSSITKKLRSSGHAALLTFVSLVPCLGLIVPALIDREVRQAYRDHGLRPGVFGMSTSEVFDAFRAK
ncbi:MAG TPA: hypothetical protein PK156_39580 [Polyangium sp.]|nr:hypothetical protein [Polyangium sp.]